MILVHGKEDCKYTEAIIEHLLIDGEAARFNPNIDQLEEFKGDTSLCTVAAQETGFAGDKVTYAKAKVVVQVLPDIASEHLVGSGAKISYKTLTEFAPVANLVNELELGLVVIDKDFPGMHSWIKRAELENTGIVSAVVVSDFVKGYDEQWAQVLEGLDGIKVYGKGWEQFSGWDSKRFLGPVSEEEASKILSTAKCTPVLDWHSCEPYRAIATGCFPMYLHSMLDFGSALQAFLSHPRGIRTLLRIAKQRLEPNWRELHDRIKMD